LRSDVREDLPIIKFPLLHFASLWPFDHYNGPGDREAYEREFVLRKLQENRWNMTNTAAALGLERSHLYRKMRALKIAPSKAAS
ncbi:MAG: hypothetical protein KGL75_11775, partial [Acidobacteriota bacterium]|nr:hypothetical protein [Acidobacteriota bacterium]